MYRHTSLYSKLRHREVGVSCRQNSQASSSATKTREDKAFLSLQQLVPTEVEHWLDGQLISGFTSDGEYTLCFDVQLEKLLTYRDRRVKLRGGDFSMNFDLISCVHLDEDMFAPFTVETTYPHIICACVFRFESDTDPSHPATSEGREKVSLLTIDVVKGEILDRVSFSADECCTWDLSSCVSVVEGRVCLYLSGEREAKVFDLSHNGKLSLVSTVGNFKYPADRDEVQHADDEVMRTRRPEDEVEHVPERMSVSQLLFIGEDGIDDAHSEDEDGNDAPLVGHTSFERGQLQVQGHGSSSMMINPFIQSVMRYIYVKNVAKGRECLLNNFSALENGKVVGATLLTANLVLVRIGSPRMEGTPKPGFTTNFSMRDLVAVYEIEKGEVVDLAKISAICPLHPFPLLSSNASPSAWTLLMQGRRIGGDASTDSARRTAEATDVPEAPDPFGGDEVAKAKRKRLLEAARVPEEAPPLKKCQRICQCDRHSLRSKTMGDISPYLNPSFVTLERSSNRLSNEDMVPEIIRRHTLLDGRGKISVAPSARRLTMYGGLTIRANERRGDDMDDSDVKMRRRQMWKSKEWSGGEGGRGRGKGGADKLRGRKTLAFPRMFDAAKWKEEVTTVPTARGESSSPPPLPAGHPSVVPATVYHSGATDRSFSGDNEDMMFSPPPFLSLFNCNRARVLADISIARREGGCQNLFFNPCRPLILAVDVEERTVVAFTPQT
uniref:Uncharacterized protein n=1 Tax=Palpitomonas bilix TaxID=652834 RepID=A0A7S3CWV5_9EUKA|mmetsp:Transcript_1022/g.2119  ORF Transcript_1022/g.2119 Transcript_1022/m.2119 type:complete len:723 (+) Transcript_1022:262-2430(+)